MNLSGHQSARMKSADWLTPPDWLERLGGFDLDPCCPAEMPWRTAGRMVMRPDDGFEIPWEGRVWLNPPFGNQAAKWLKKLRQHGNGIALIPARTETAMFYESVWSHARAICFAKGRPHFYTPKGNRASFNSGAPICLVAYGDQNWKALLDANLGIVLEINPEEMT